MSDPIAILLRRNLHEVFGERDAARRRAAITALFTEDATFADPHGLQSGHEALDRSVSSLLARSPRFRCKLWTSTHEGPRDGAFRQPP